MVESLEKILTKTGVDAAIIAKAVAIYNALPPDILKWKTSARFYLCTRDAYRSALIDPSLHCSLEELFNFRSGVKKLEKNSWRCGYRCAIAVYEPKHFIQRYLRILGIDFSLTDTINQLIQQYLDAKTNEGEKLPQNIAAAAVLYYAQNGGYKIDKVDYISKCDAKSVILKLVELIGEADNAC